MHRIQIQLTDEQERMLRAPELAGRESCVAAALDAIGAFDSGLPDVGTRHDEYLVDALVERLGGRRKHS